MGVTITHNVNAQEQKFNGIRRTPEGMLYLTSIDPNVDNDSIQYSNFFEEGKSDSVPLGLESDLILTVPRATLKTVTFNYKINSNIEAPISKGMKLGVVDVLSDGKLLTSKPLIALDTVEEKGFLGRFIDKLILWFINLFDFNND